MAKVNKKPSTTNPAADVPMNGQAQDQENSSVESEWYLEEVRSYALSKYIVLRPENDEGNWYLDHLEKNYFLPATVSWLDENGWVNRLFIRPQGPMPRFMKTGLARFRFETGSWHWDRSPKTFKWVPFRTFLHCEPAEVPPFTHMAMVMGMEIPSDAESDRHQDGPLKDAGDIQESPRSK